MKENGEKWQNETVNGQYLVSNKDEYDHLQAIVYGEHPLYIEIVIRDEKDIPYLKTCIRRCQYHFTSLITAE